MKKICKAKTEQLNRLKRKLINKQQQQTKIVHVKSKNENPHPLRQQYLKIEHNLVFFPNHNFLYRHKKQPVLKMHRQPNPNYPEGGFAATERTNRKIS